MNGKIGVRKFALLALYTVCKTFSEFRLPFSINLLEWGVQKWCFRSFPASTNFMENLGSQTLQR